MQLLISKKIDFKDFLCIKKLWMCLLIYLVNSLGRETGGKVSDIF